MRVGVVDIGTNSTRLMVADVAEDGSVTELERRSTVTRLGQGVDTSGTLAQEAMDRVFAALSEYRAIADDLGVEFDREAGLRLGLVVLDLLADLLPHVVPGHLRGERQPGLPHALHQPRHQFVIGRRQG